MLRAVPTHLKVASGVKKLETDVDMLINDPKYVFLNNLENRNKYYYIRRGNILQPLGNLDHFIAFNLSRGSPSIEDDGYMHYMMHFVYFPFENGPRTNSYALEPNLPAQHASGMSMLIAKVYDESHFFDNGKLANENAELYYTDEAPAAGSVPLTINDLNHQETQRGGKKTQKKYRKNKKNKLKRKQRTRKVQFSIKGKVQGKP